MRDRENRQAARAAQTEEDRLAERQPNTERHRAARAGQTEEERQNERVRNREQRRRARASQTEQNRSAARIADTQARREARTSVGHTRSNLNSFRERFAGLQFGDCVRCNRRVFMEKINDDSVCATCVKADASAQGNRFTAENNMDPGSAVDILSNLTMMESMLISRVHPVISAYRVQWQQYKYHGNVINFPQRVQQLSDQLPHSLAALRSTILVVRKQTSNDEAYEDFRVRRVPVQLALDYLIRNNRYYRDLQIAWHVLDGIPDDGNFYNELCGVGSAVSEYDIEELGEADSDFEDGLMAHSGVPDHAFLGQRESIAATLTGTAVGTAND